MDKEIQDAVPECILDVIKRLLESLKEILEFDILPKFLDEGRKVLGEKEIKSIEKAEKKYQKFKRDMDEGEKESSAFVFYTTQDVGQAVFSLFCQRSKVYEFRWYMKLNDVLKLKNDYVAFMMAFHECWQGIMKDTAVDPSRKNEVLAMLEKFWDSSTSRPRSIKNTSQEGEVRKRSGTGLPKHKINSDKDRKEKKDGEGKNTQGSTWSKAEHKKKGKNDKILISPERSNVKADSTSKAEKGRIDNVTSPRGETSADNSADESEDEFLDFARLTLNPEAGEDASTEKVDSKPPNRPPPLPPNRETDGEDEKKKKDKENEKEKKYEKEKTTERSGEAVNEESYAEESESEDPVETANDNGKTKRSDKKLSQQPAPRPHLRAKDENEKKEKKEKGKKKEKKEKTTESSGDAVDEESNTESESEDPVQNEKANDKGKTKRSDKKVMLSQQPAPQRLRVNGKKEKKAKHDATPEKADREND